MQFNDILNLLSISQSENMKKVISIIALLLIIGPLGGMVSIIYAVRIEPLKALRLG